MTSYADFNASTDDLLNSMIVTCPDQPPPALFSQNGHGNPNPNGAARWRPEKIWSAAELLATNFPEPEWRLHGILPPGLGGLGSRPKLGKSWLALQMSTAISLGVQLWGRETRRTHVFYLALEDNARTLKERLQSQRAGGDMWLDFVDEWPAVTSFESLLVLEELIQQKEYGLVIVDTITRVLGRADVMNQGAMAEVFTRLHKLAKDTGATVLLIDHHHKGAAGDCIDDFMGATSKTGILDFAMGLYRQRGERAATLRIDGRVTRDASLALQWDHDLTCWQYVGEARDIAKDSVQGEIVAALQEMGGSSTTKKIADYLQRNKGSISRELAELVNKHKVRRDERKGHDVVYRLIDSESTDQKGE